MVSVWIARSFVGRRDVLRFVLDDQAFAFGGLFTVLSRVRSQRSFEFSDCTPKHLSVEPAPACEETPDLFGQHVTIRYTTALRGMARPNQTDVNCR